MNGGIYMNKKIGVFDSGIGGLNVLNDLCEKFPSEDFIFLADSKNCPYGIKSNEEVRKITENNIRYFESLDVKAIIIACNTATTQSYGIESNVPIVRIIAPTALEAKKIGGRIGVLATNMTVDTQAYQMFLPDAIGIRGSTLVNIAEEGNARTDISYNELLSLLNPVKNKIDTIILGCTHFTVFTEEVKTILPGVEIVDSSLSISPVLEEVIEINKTKKIGEVIIQITGEIEDVNLQWFKSKYVKIEKVTI